MKICANQIRYLAMAGQNLLAWNLWQSLNLSYYDA